MSKMVKIEESVLNELKQSVHSLASENAKLKQEIEKLNGILLNAQRARFGQSSEKREYIFDDVEQILLFNEAEVERNYKALEPTEETFVKEHIRKSKRTREEMLASLPQKDVLIEFNEEEMDCEICGHKLKYIGKKFVRQEMHIIPRQVQLINYYTATYTCEACDKRTGYNEIINPVAPPSLLKHSLASPSTVADVITKKYVDGLPLARQEKIWKREGVELSRATLANWVIQTSQTWLKPLYKHMRKKLLKSDIIHADETTLQVLKEDGKTAQSESRMWVYTTSKDSETAIRYFEYQPDRKGDRAADVLKDFTGYLITDGYAGYNKVKGATHCACWAHMKRYWREAMPEKATLENSQAAIGFAYCTKLFKYEKEFELLTYEDRLKKRQEKSKPLLEEYWNWVKTVKCSNGSNLEKAVKYALNHQTELSVFLDNGKVELSNNWAENALRPMVVGRKNWLFADTVKGAQSSAIAYTIVETAKANGLDPFHYLNRVLSLIRYYGKNPSAAELEELMPWNPDLSKVVKSV